MVGTGAGRMEPLGEGWGAADSKLAPFGLSTAACHRIMSAAVTEAARAPARGSATAAGFYGYQGGLAEMDLQLDEAGYKREDVLLQPFFASDDFNVTITPAAGNRYVGVPGQGKLVASRYKKGPVTKAALGRNVDPNQHNISELVPVEDASAFERLQFGKVTDARLEWVTRHNVWMLLTHLDSNAREVRASLSLARDHTINKRVCRWIAHVHIPAYPLPVDVTLPTTPGIDFDLPEISEE